MFANHSRFADWRDPRWEIWRQTERESPEIVRFCATCGVTHKQDNHCPEKPPPCPGTS